MQTSDGAGSARQPARFRIVRRQAASLHDRVVRIDVVVCARRRVGQHASAGRPRRQPARRTRRRGSQRSQPCEPGGREARATAKEQLSKAEAATNSRITHDLHRRRARVVASPVRGSAGIRRSRLESKLSKGWLTTMAARGSQCSLNNRVCMQSEAASPLPCFGRQHGRSRRVAMNLDGAPWARCWRRTINEAGAHSRDAVASRVGALCLSGARRQQQ